MIGEVDPTIINLTVFVLAPPARSKVIGVYGWVQWQ